MGKKMGNYCKAYPINRFREYSGWTEYLENLRKETKKVQGKEVEVARELTDDDYFYLQENFNVTDGIFLDENVIFDVTTPEWIDFCKNTLKFEVPAYEPITAADATKENFYPAEQPVMDDPIEQPVMDDLVEQSVKKE